MRKLFIATTVAMSLMSASAEVTFNYDESTKTLTFSGEGEMNVYAVDIFGDTYISPEWANLKDDAEKVIINEGVTNIGKHAFISFSKLKEVSVASTVKTIDVAAFEECSSLTDINLPEGLTTLGEDVFYECKSLESISIPKTVTHLPNFAFQSCNSLKHIDWESVTTCGRNVFAYCNFESIEIPAGMKTLSENLFFCCKNLKTIDIPSTVEKLESGVFYYCALDTINFLGEIFPEITGFNVFNVENKNGNTVIRINCKSYSEDVVNKINDHGGAYTTNIIPAWPAGTKISSTNNTYGPIIVTPIDCDKNIYKLTVDLWNSFYKVTWEGDYDFPEEDLNKIEITVDLSNPTTIIANVEDDFGGGGGGIIIPTEIDVEVEVYGKGKVNVTKIESSEESATFKLVAIPDEGYKFSRWSPFSFTINLTDEEMINPEIEITIPYFSYIDAYFVKEGESGSPAVNSCGKDGGDNVTWYIKNDTLYLEGQGEMEDYGIFDDVPYTLTDDDYSVIKIGEGITNVGNAAFAFLVDVNKIYLPSTLTNVGEYAFSASEDITNIYFAGTTPPTFAKLEQLFYLYSETLEINVPCSALEVYKRVFAEYSEYDEEDGEIDVDIKVACDENPQVPSDPVFDYFTFDPSNVCGAEGDGSNILWAFDEATGTLALKGSGKMKDYTNHKKVPWNKLEVKKLIVSDGINTIGAYALYEQKALVEMTLPTTLDTICDYAFESTALIEANIPEGVERIGIHSFYGTSATKATLPTTLASIGSSAFQYCKLSTIEIPASVVRIGRGAFDNSHELNVMVFKGTTPPSTGGYSFITNSTGEIKKLIVPCEAVDAYKTAPGYNNAMIQGEFPFELKLSQKVNNNVSDLGGRAWVIQWPDCENGVAIVYPEAKNAYVFSHWEAEGIMLTEEQSKMDTLSIVVDADCKLTAVFKDKNQTRVEVVNANDVVVTISNATISVNRDNFQIFDILGRDVTYANGALKPAVYVVKCDGKAYKAIIKQ